MQKVLNVEVASYPDVMNTGCNVMAVICQDEAGMLAVYVGVVKLIKYDPTNLVLAQALELSPNGRVAQVTFWASAGLASKLKNRVRI